MCVLCAALPHPPYSGFMGKCRLPQAAGARHPLFLQRPILPPSKPVPLALWQQQQQCSIHCGVIEPSAAHTWCCCCPCQLSRWWLYCLVHHLSFARLAVTSVLSFGTLLVYSTAHSSMQRIIFSCKQHESKQQHCLTNPSGETIQGQAASETTPTSWVCDLCLGGNSMLTRYRPSEPLLPGNVCCV